MAVGNLTELERAALLPGVINLSDGHARQSLSAESGRRAREIFDAYASPGTSDYFGAEQQFLDFLTGHTRQRYVPGQHFITYSSSLAIGMIATHLKRERRTLGLLHPTFDSIPGIMAIKEVPMVPVAEEWFVPACDLDRLESLGVGALMLVAPNNPTGACLDRMAMCGLLDWAARRRVQLIVDLAFRWFDPAAKWDIIAAAEARGADVLTIDDTGKILSLADLKVGVLSASRGLSQRIQEIHDQYTLNVSELTLRLLTALMDPSRDDNEVTRAIQIVQQNRYHLQGAFAMYNHQLGMPWRHPTTPAMSVEWLHLPRNHAEIVHDCHSRGLEILPGGGFYWSPYAETPPYVRVALMRDPSYFARGADILMSVLSDHFQNIRLDACGQWPT
jgi:aspartate/methionine/tyrosine aminotransferase